MREMTGTVVVTERDRDRHRHRHRHAPDRDCVARPDRDRRSSSRHHRGRPPLRAATAAPQRRPPRRRPKISSAVFKRSKRTITVAGTSQASGKVKVELSYKNGKATRKKTLSRRHQERQVQRHDQALGADARKAKKLTVTASSNGTSSAKKSVSIKK